MTVSCRMALSTPTGTPSRNSNENRQDGQLNGDRDPGLNHLPGRDVVAIGFSQLSPRDLLEPTAILDRDRLVEAELARDLLLGCGIDEPSRCEENVNDISGG